MNNDTTTANGTTGIHDPVASAEESYNQTLEQLRTLHPESKRLIDRLDSAVGEVVAGVENHGSRKTVLDRVERLEAGCGELRQAINGLRDDLKRALDALDDGDPLS